MSGDTSPVKAPLSSWCMFCAPTLMFDPFTTLATSARETKGGTEHDLHAGDVFQVAPDGRGQKARLVDGGVHLPVACYEWSAQEALLSLNGPLRPVFGQLTRVRQRLKHQIFRLERAQGTAGAGAFVERFHTVAQRICGAYQHRHGVPAMRRQNGGRGVVSRYHQHVGVQFQDSRDAGVQILQRFYLGLEVAVLSGGVGRLVVQVEKKSWSW